MAASKSLGTTAGNCYFLEYVGDMQVKLEEIKQAIALLPNVAPPAELESACMDLDRDNTCAYEKEFGAAEPSGKPIRAKLESEEETILCNKLERVLPPLPFGRGRKGSLLIEIANGLTTDLTCSSFSRLKVWNTETESRFPDTIQAGATETVMMPSLFLAPDWIFSFQITNELKLIVSYGRDLTIALAPSHWPLLKNAVVYNFYDGMGSEEDPEPNQGDDADSNNLNNDMHEAWSFRQRKLMLRKSACDYSEIALHSKETIVARNRTVLAGARQNESNGLVLQIGIADDIEVCSSGKHLGASPPKRKRKMEHGKSFGVQTGSKPSTPGKAPEKILQQEFTTGDIVAQSLELYGYVLEIENFLDCDLGNPDWYLEGGYAPESIPGTVNANETNVTILKCGKRTNPRKGGLIFTGKGSGGVVTYKIGQTDLLVAIAFRLVNSGNIFAAAFLSNQIETDDNLLDDMLSGDFWVTSPDRKCAQAKDGHVIIEVRNIRAKVTMTTDFKAVVKVQIKTY